MAIKKLTKEERYELAALGWWGSNVLHAIKSDNQSTLLDMIRTELATLRRYERQKDARLRRAKNQSDVDVDELAFIYSQKYGDLQERIEQLTTARALIKNSKTTGIGYRELLDYAKARTVYDRQKATVSQMYAAINDENINETFYRMFNKGNYLLHERELKQFDELFNKYGIGITTAIKTSIKNNYKHWTSDIAYTFISEWSSRATNLIESNQVSEEDITLMKKYVATVKSRL